MPMILFPYVYVLISVLSVLLSLSAQAESTQTPMTDLQSPMHLIRIQVGPHQLTAELTDTPSARDFLALLPLTLVLKDYASTEKIADLPQKLSTRAAPAGFDPSAGDITYYAPWGNLAIFYRDFSYSHGLIPLGRITQGLEHLHFRAPQSVYITALPL